jgi:2-polyprenyl-3-methyl-5-hydroxy-6-metoxy-1,4-benzoquinol methylase
MSRSVLEFYNQLAPSYRLIFKNWKRSVANQGGILDRIIQLRLGRKPPMDLLDCSCGIGTQAIGLALRHYKVYGTDLSPKAIQEARKAARELGGKAFFGVADFRKLSQDVQGQFDVIISCDNSLPHLLTSRDLRRTLRNIHQKVRPGGLVLLSIRDYDRLAREKPAVTPPLVMKSASGNRIYFQTWRWAKDGKTYQLRLFLIRKTKNRIKVKTFVTRYRVLKRAELTGMLKKAGFKNIQWELPAKSGYYQPIVTAYSKSK